MDQLFDNYVVQAHCEVRSMLVKDYLLKRRLGVGVPSFAMKRQTAASRV